MRHSPGKPTTVERRAHVSLQEKQGNAKELIERRKPYPDRQGANVHPF